MGMMHLAFAFQFFAKPIQSTQVVLKLLNRHLLENLNTER
jgi:hypothetical protein